MGGMSAAMQLSSGTGLLPSDAIPPPPGVFPAAAPPSQTHLLDEPLPLRTAPRPVPGASRPHTSFQGGSPTGCSPSLFAIPLSPILHSTAQPIMATASAAVTDIPASPLWSQPVPDLPCPSSMGMSPTFPASIPRVPRMSEDPLSPSQVAADFYQRGGWHQPHQPQLRVGEAPLGLGAGGQSLQGVSTPPEPVAGCVSAEAHRGQGAGYFRGDQASARFSTSSLGSPTEEPRRSLETWAGEWRALEKATASQLHHAPSSRPLNKSGLPFRHQEPALPPLVDQSCLQAPPSRRYYCANCTMPMDHAAPLGAGVLELASPSCSYCGQAEAETSSVPSQWISMAAHDASVQAMPAWMPGAGAVAGLMPALQADTAGAAATGPACSSYSTAEGSSRSGTLLAYDERMTLHQEVRACMPKHIALGAKDYHVWCGSAGRRLVSSFKWHGYGRRAVVAVETQTLFRALCRMYCCAMMHAPSTPQRALNDPNLQPQSPSLFGREHPERPSRVKSIMERLKATGVLGRCRAVRTAAGVCCTAGHWGA